jgi:hypothetical protein
MDRIPEPEWIFPFDSMDVGDSFFIPTLRPAELIFVVENRAKVAGLKVKAYPSSKDDTLGIRVWRVL